MPEHEGPLPAVVVEVLVNHVQFKVLNLFLFILIAKTLDVDKITVEGYKDLGEQPTY